MTKKEFKPIAIEDQNATLEVCSPLKRIFNANLFIYQRSKINKKENRVESNSYLCSSADVLSFIFSLAPKNREPAKYDYSGKRKYIFMDGTQPSFTAMIRDKFGIYNLLSRDEQIDNYEWEHFIIGTATKDISAINNYLNNIDVIDKFLAFFRDKTSNIIGKACRNSVASGRLIEKFNFGDLGGATGAIGSGDFSLVPEPSRYYLNNNENKKVAVPKSEMRCLIILSRGRSAKEIGNILGISQRTVEGYIASARLRLGCNTKSKLLDIIDGWRKSNIWSV